MQKSRKPVKRVSFSEGAAIVLLYIVSTILSFFLCILVAQHFVFNAYPDPGDGRERIALGIGAIMLAIPLSFVVFGPLMTLVLSHYFGDEKKAAKQKEKQKNKALDTKEKHT